MSTVTLTMPDGEARKPYEFRQVLKGTGPFKIIAALLPDGLKAQITGSTLVVYGTLPQGTNVFPVTVEVGNCCGQNTTFISSLTFTDDCPVVEDCGACSFTFSATNTLITTAGVSHHLEVHGTPGATFTVDVVGSFAINGKEYKADNHRAESIPVGGVWTFDTAPSKAGDQALFSFSITPTGRYRGQTVCGGPFYVTTSVPVVPAVPVAAAGRVVAAHAVAVPAGLALPRLIAYQDRRHRHAPRHCRFGGAPAAGDPGG